MKRKILIAIYIILILITIKLFSNSIINRFLINKYNNGQYSEKQAKSLTYLNYIQSYVAYYNYGNILYQNGEYENAIEEYKKALSSNIPKDKECNIRINYTLAICKTVQINEKEQDSIKNAIKTYETAIDILTEKSCDLHNQKAQQLKKDIQKEINRLKKLLENKDDNNSNDNKDEKDNKTKNDTETIETKIQDIKVDATKEQRELENQYKYYTKNFNGNKKNW